MSDSSPGRIKRAWESPGAFWAAAVVVVALVGMAIAIYVTRDHSDSHSSTAEPSTSTSPSTSASAPADPLAGQYVTLPRPTGQTFGYPTQYPHTATGAAATALAYFTAMESALDYDTATNVAKAYMTNLPFSYEKAGDSIVSLSRSSAKIPLNGSPVAGITTDVAIDGVKWTTNADGRVVVLAEVHPTWTKPDGTVREAKVAAPIGTFVWKQGRWWLDGSAQTSGVEEAYQEPGTDGFVAAGWQIVRNSDWSGGLL